MFGSDILFSEKMQSEKNFVQHANVSCYEHSVNVAEKSLFLARVFNKKVDEKSLVRGALLHDYFLYDWHMSGHRLHGFFHAKRALRNAERDFELSEIEKDIIKRHMFPLNLCPPKFRESRIVCLADKICAIEEIFSNYNFSKRAIIKKMCRASKRLALLAIVFISRK